MWLGTEAGPSGLGIQAKALAGPPTICLLLCAHGRGAWRAGDLLTSQLPPSLCVELCEGCKRTGSGQGLAHRVQGETRRLESGCKGCIDSKFHIQGPSLVFLGFV